MKEELLSTFNVGEPTFQFNGTLQCGRGKFANCMTAKCTKETAFDGSPITCMCRVEEDEFSIAKAGDATCQLPQNLLWSGTITPKD